MSKTHTTHPSDMTPHTGNLQLHLPAESNCRTRRSRTYGWLRPVFLAGLMLAGWILWSKWDAARVLCDVALSSAGSVAVAQPGRSARASFDLSNATIPQNKILPGGPPKDRIPALSNPKFIAASRAGFLKPNDRVIGVVLGDEARAYPLKILDYHEVVNDRVGDVPLAVTYCPLCDSAAVFDRRSPNGEREFGVSGLLYNSNVLLFNRGKNGSESLWSQMMATAVAGPSVGMPLKSIPLELTTWSNWSTRYVNTKVLATETGHHRNYSRSPYSPYFASPELMFPATPQDRRLPLKARVLGVSTDTEHRAYPVAVFKTVGQDRQIDQELGGHHFRLSYNADSKSLRIVRAGDGLKWMYSYWFAWYAFHPDTDVFDLSGTP